MIRIAVTGPESTGKSTLAAQLAGHYNGLLRPEFARNYLEQFDHPYTYKDVVFIAEEQQRIEKQLFSSEKKLLIVDTELIVIKIWMEYKFGICPEWIKNEIAANPYDHYLLCDIDIPWEPDPLREHPDLRQFFFDWFRKELEAFKLNYSIISGKQQERFARARAIIEEVVKRQNI